MLHPKPISFAFQREVRTRRDRKAAPVTEIKELATTMATLFDANGRVLHGIHRPPRPPPMPANAIVSGLSPWLSHKRVRPLARAAIGHNVIRARAIDAKT